jgi:hypothetical protein
MGGSGSGRWKYHEKKRTTEECWALDVADLPQGTLDKGAPSGVLQAVRLDGRSSVLCVRWALELGENPVLTLSYQPYRRAEGRELTERVRLITTEPHFGGVRGWFACPFSWKGGESCGRRVSNLYLPPGEGRFGCRQCHALAYKSSQESHRYDRLCALMVGEDSGEAFEALRRLFLSNARIARRRATRVPRSSLETFDEVLGKR